jgi:hypothetical protein
MFWNEENHWKPPLEREKKLGEGVPFANNNNCIYQKDIS